MVSAENVFQMKKNNLRKNNSKTSIHTYILDMIFQIGIGVLLFLSFLDILFAFVWHPSGMKMYWVDYSNGIIKHMTFVSKIRSNLANSNYF